MRLTVASGGALVVAWVLAQLFPSLDGPVFAVAMLVGLIPIAHRAAMAGLDLGLRLRLDAGLTVRDPLPWLEGAVRATWHGHGHLDGYRLYRGDVGRTLPVSCSLKSISRMVGLSPVEVDVVRLHELRPTEVATYVASDARMARLLVDRRAPAALASVD